MKKLSIGPQWGNFLFAILLVVIVVSCKDEDEGPTFQKEDFIGTWERTETTAEDDCDVSTEVLVITDTQMEITSNCDGFELEFEETYTFDNKQTISMEIFGIPGKFVIKSLTSTTMVVDLYAENQKTGTSTYEKQ